MFYPEQPLTVRWNLIENKSTKQGHDALDANEMMSEIPMGRFIENFLKIANAVAAF